MIVGYKIQCNGLKEPMSIKGENLDNCLSKFRQYWESDYDVNTYELTRVESITVDFDIE